MSNEYIYGQPTYGENAQYQIGNAGIEYGTSYDVSNYQQVSNQEVLTREPISYEEYEKQQKISYDQNPAYTQQIYYQNPKTQVIPGNYYQIHQETHQQIFPQSQTIAQKEANLAQQQVKKENQMVQQNQNIYHNQIIQQPSGSRNPNIISQYRQQQPPLIQKNNSGQINQQNPLMQQKYFSQMNQQQQTYGEDQLNEIQYQQPQIQPDFQPEIPIVNSVLNQSQIPFEQNKSQVGIAPAYSPKAQNQMAPSYVIPRRNPNINLKQYDYYSNDSHFVTSADPGSSTIPIKEQNMLIQKKDSSNIQNKEYGEQISQKTSGKIKNSLENESINQPEVGFGISNLEQNSDMNGIQKLEKSESGLDNSEINGIKSAVSVVKSMEPFMESKMNEEIENENENPIEEKLPDQNIEENLNNKNEVNEVNEANEANKANEVNETNETITEKKSENPSQIGDIDDNYDVLPSINSIMKGNAGLLPPPNKKKYK